MKIDASSTAQTLQNLAQAATFGAAKGAPVAVQAHAMEEVGMLFSQNVERSSKALSKRQLDMAGAEPRTAKVEKLEVISKWYSQLGHPGQVSLVALAQRSTQLLHQQPTLGAVLHLSEGDPARADLVLQAATVMAESEGRKREAALAREYLARLRKAYRAQIDAGMNIAEALLATGGDPALRQAVRQLYYNTVVLKQSLPGMMQALLGLFGEQDFDSGLQTMRRALADDIAAENPSRPSGKLRTLLLGLNASSHLGSVLQSCRGLLERLASSRLEQQLSAVALLQRLVGYAAGGFSPAEAQRLGRELGGEQAHAQLVSLNALYPLIQRLPLPLWRDGKSRQNALKNLLALMDQRSRHEPRAQAVVPVIAGVAR
ncbi:type III secretion system gatekeeper subunit SctW [Pseudomonas borbori]